MDPLIHSGGCGGVKQPKMVPNAADRKSIAASSAGPRRQPSSPVLTRGDRSASGLSEPPVLKTSAAPSLAPAFFRSSPASERPQPHTRAPAYPTCLYGLGHPGRELVADQSFEHMRLALDRCHRPFYRECRFVIRLVVLLWLSPCQLQSDRCCLESPLSLLSALQVSSHCIR